MWTVTDLVVPLPARNEHPAYAHRGERPRHRVYRQLAITAEGALPGQADKWQFIHGRIVESQVMCRCILAVAVL